MAKAHKTAHIRKHAAKHVAKHATKHHFSKENMAWFAKDRAKKYGQVGKSDVAADKERYALPAGWRVSHRGSKYFENRKNRSDVHYERKL